MSCAEVSETLFDSGLCSLAAAGGVVPLLEIKISGRSVQSQVGGSAHESETDRTHTCVGECSPAEPQVLMGHKCASTCTPLAVVHCGSSFRELARFRV